jgi:long-chain acyl-CoA synthetase
LIVGVELNFPERRPVPLTGQMSVRNALAGRHVLVTGATGFLGKVWIAQLLHDLPEIGRMTALVRGRRGESANERLERILTTSPAMRPLRRRHGKDFAGFLAARLDVLAGDAARPRAGLDDRSLAALRGSVDLVVHFAGLTDFQPDPTEAIATNVHGALHMAGIAVELGVPMVHVSTAYVAGRADGRISEDLDPEISPRGLRFSPSAELAAIEAGLASLPAGRAARQQRVDLAASRAEKLGWPNIYTYTKALAERLLVQVPGLDVTIVRPSIVECARRFPLEGWNEGLNTSAPLAWLISTSFREFPSRAHHHFDIAPVDLVGRGCTLAAAAAVTGRGGGILHLGTSGSNPVHFGRIIELTGLANRKRLQNGGGGSAWERWVVPHLDPVAVHADHRPPWHVSHLRQGARWVGKALQTLQQQNPTSAPEIVRQTSDEWLKQGLRRSQEAARELGRIERMLAMYQPFVHDQDYVFVNERVRALSSMLPPDEKPNFEWDCHTIDWRQYWHDVQYPGLWTWSIPLITGGEVPEDPPCEPPLALHAACAPALHAAAEAP